ncbi:YqaJ viral recombinase family protein [Marinobacter sp. ELB17]|uniref:YqaJ viral recombinase family protein n=1 Tax=Marinobacter sp. ELB17 TaxID=270374 RepID=UPI0000F3B3E0|nr:YqaJ viral recombinase family protein [Marinobacter sp. ELB17]EAZ98370.1 hypothetical protein MELB17_09093 [Marinobacter sp. ELB17]
MDVDFDLISLTLKVRKVVDALPQRSHIPDDVAVRWVEGIIKRDPERAVWHANRASGIGGSEIGELVLHASGQRPMYNTLEELSRQKLLLDFPSRSNIHMERGTDMEPLAEKTYWAITKHKSVLADPEIANAFAKGHPTYPWLVGNPDDVVDAPSLGRLITDFKVRSNLDSEEGMKLINACQLHWYGLIHEGQFGKLPDGYGLAELDIPTPLIDSLRGEDNPDFQAMAETIASVNKPGFGMQIRYFKHNPALANHMTRLAEQFWNKYVMTGQPFVTPKPEKPAEMSKQDESKIRGLLNDLVRFKIAENVSKMECDRVRSDIFELTDRYEMDVWPFEVPGLSAGYSSKFDINRAATALITKGIDRVTLAKPSDALDMDAVHITLENNGLLTDSLYKPTWDPRAVKSALKKLKIPVSDFNATNFRAGISTKRADQDTRHTLETSMGIHIQKFGQDEPSLSQQQNDGVSPDRSAPNGNIDILSQLDDDDDHNDSLRIG